MRESFALSVAFVAAAIWLTACATSQPGERSKNRSVPTLDAASASAAGLSVQEVSDGLKLSVAKCVRCHKFYHPADYEEHEWQKWMAKMSKKSRLKPDQEELLSRYLAAFRVSGQLGRKDAKP